VDDGSRDGTRDRLDRWEREDARVRVLVTGGGPGEPRGIVAALRRAAGAARAPLLARMDADDVAAPDRLAEQLRLMDRRRDLAACGTRVRYFGPEGVGSGYRRYEEWINGCVTPEEIRRDLLVECPLPHPTLVVRRSVYRALGGYRQTGWPEDYDLVLRLYRAGMAAGKVPRVLLRWRLHPESLSRRSPEYTAAAFRRCKAHFLVAGFLPDDRCPVVWGAGSVGKALGRALRETGRQPRAWVELDPAKIGQEIHGAPVWSPEELFGRWPTPETPGRRLQDRVLQQPPHVLAAVGSPGARDEIRQALRDRGWRELRDFRAVA